MTPTTVKRLAARMLCHELIGAGIAALFRQHIPTRGHRIYAAGHRVTNGTRARLFWGFYERAEVDFVFRHLPSNLDVVELGGSIGVVSCAILARLASTRRLVTVEPDPGLGELLLRNLNANYPGRDFEIVNAALSYSVAPGASVEYRVGETNVAGRLGGIDASDSRTITVSAISLAYLLELYGVGDYVLVSDIEGAELGVLRYDVSSLESCQRMIIELHEISERGEIVTVEQSIARIRDLGFVLLERYGGVCAFSR